MKRLLPVILSLGLLLLWKGAQQPEVIHVGLNAIVVAVDPDMGTVTVSDPTGKQVFGDSCVLTWEREPADVVYCDFETNVLTVIDLSDLRPGDAITVNALETQLNQADSGRMQVQQIQLMTQRIK